MTLVDWSDAESMFGLLLDYVADAISENEGGEERQVWLASLFEQLNEIDKRLGSLRMADLVAVLSHIHEEMDPEHANDEVATHLLHCVEELQGCPR